MVEAEVKEETGGVNESEAPLKAEDVTEPICKRSRQEAEPSCRLQELQVTGRERVRTGATFWPSGWRSNLCSCNSCQVRSTHLGSYRLSSCDNCDITPSPVIGCVIRSGASV